MNGVVLGRVETDALKRAGLDLAPLARRSPSVKLDTPEEVAGPTLFLASDLAAWVTGVMLPLDGGTPRISGRAIRRTRDRAALGPKARRTVEPDARVLLRRLLGR